MRKIQPIFDDEKPDVLLVTGDLANIGDQNNLDRVNQWIHDKINVNAEFYGLQAKEKDCEVIIVPGNHDAFNARSSGHNWKRWQSALINYYKAFPEYALGDKGVSYRWVEKGDTKLFVCMVDSTYLGDPETKGLSHALNFSRVAKGKFSQEQCAQILTLYDQGTKGDLRDKNGERISQASFLASFKMLVMHHYLFEPSESTATPLLHIKQKQSVFQNLAMADFDALFCGHKHISDFKSFVYLDHFEPRGKIRYAFNHIRRVLGIKSLPLKVSETEGKAVRKAWRFLLSILYLNHAGDDGITEKKADEIIEKLEEGLRDKRAIKDEVLEYLLKQRTGRATGLFERDEIITLHRQIMKRFHGSEKKDLWRLSESIRPLVAKLASRPFAQVVAGSACKSSAVESRARSFNAYEIESLIEQEKYKLTVKRYSWNHSASEGEEGGAWGEDPLIQSVEMPFNRSTWKVIENAIA